MLNVIVSTIEGWGPEAIERFRAFGVNAAFAEDGWQESFCRPEDIDIIIGRQLVEKWPQEIYTNLKYIQVMSAGLDSVPVDELLARGVLVSNGRGLYSSYISEWILAQVLDSCRNLDYFKEVQREHKWMRHAMDNSNIALEGRTVSIVGPGSIGRAAAKRFKGFDMHVIAVNRSVITDCPYIDETVSLENRTEAFERSDVVVVTIPLTPETRGIIDAKSLDSMRDDAIFVNIARGGVVDEPALIERLEKGKFRRAALDVFAREPLPADSPIWDFPNVTVSPHDSSHAVGLDERRLQFACDNLSRYLKGEKLVNQR